MSRVGSDTFQVVAIVGGLLLAIFAVGAFFMTRGTSEKEVTTDMVRLFFNTTNQGLSKNAWMALHNSTRDRFSYEEFDQLVQSHSAFKPFQSFEPGDADFGDEQRVQGELRVAGQSYQLDARLAPEDGVAKILDIQVDGRSLFESSVTDAPAVN